MTISHIAPPSPLNNNNEIGGGKFPPGCLNGERYTQETPWENVNAFSGYYT
jgi:hypothetical protein